MDYSIQACTHIPLCLGCPAHCVAPHHSTLEMHCWLAVAASCSPTTIQNHRRVWIDFGLDDQRCVCLCDACALCSSLLALAQTASPFIMRHLSAGVCWMWYTPPARCSSSHWLCQSGRMWTLRPAEPRPWHCRCPTVLTSRCGSCCTLHFYLSRSRIKYQLVKQEPWRSKCWGYAWADFQMCPVTPALCRLLWSTGPSPAGSMSCSCGRT